jgi:hypothetical protein
MENARCGPAFLLTGKERRHAEGATIYTDYIASGPPRSVYSGRVLGRCRRVMRCGSIRTAEENPAG